jgi:hypothetical protein
MPNSFRRACYVAVIISAFFTFALSPRATAQTPQISSISPSSGPPGTRIVISGTGFGTSQEAGSVMFEGAYLPAGVLSWSDSQITAFAPNDAATGPVTVSVAEMSSNGVNFTVTSPPNISGLSPNTGATGQVITITGSGFGPSQQGGTVHFNGAVASPSSWSDASIQVQVPANATSGNVVVIASGVGSNSAAFTVLPGITKLLPTSGAPGAAVTIAGHDFGWNQPSGNPANFNGTPAPVTSWGPSAVVVTVPAGATTGDVILNIDGVATNGVRFTVLPIPTIGNVSPDTGAAGTQVTITGSGFGATRGSGSVRLGSTYGLVTAWSDTQVVASVATGAKSGTAQITQSSVSSNAVAFNVITPVVTGVNPGSGAGGTTVTISGTGFGAAQGNGNVWLGTTYGVISTWSETQIVATVASSSRSGTVKVLQNGVWSDPLQFDVVGSPPTTTISPSMMNVVVAESRAIQALDSNGAVVSGLTWASSDTAIVSLSTDDPPILTALAAGHATISAGDGVADVIVHPIPTPENPALPPGTILWSVPGDVSQILPAVPSSNGVADVFAVGSSGNVQAVNSDGIVAWTAALGTQSRKTPDFQGGLVIADNSQTIERVDGRTSQTRWVYTSTYPCSSSSSSNITDCSADGYIPVAVHTDGTVFTIDGDKVVGLDPATGSAKFNVQLEHSTDLDHCIGSSFNCPFGDGRSSDDFPTIGQLIVAGDGYAYVPYFFEVSEWTIGPYWCDEFSTDDVHFRVLRVGPNGDYSKITVRDWHEWGLDSCWDHFWGASGAVPVDYPSPPGLPAYHFGALITNADNGVLLSWVERPLDSVGDEFSGDPDNNRLTAISASGITSDVSVRQDPFDDTFWVIRPVLQKGDGSYFGTLTHLDGNLNILEQTLMTLDQSGSTTTIATGNYEPVMATADGGVIAKTPDGTAVAFGTNQAPTGLPNLFTQTWKGNTYQQGSLDRVSADPILMAASFWAYAGANPSHTASASRPWYFILVWQNDFSFELSSGSYDPGPVDITQSAGVIKSAALKELQDAYSTTPATVIAVEGTSGTGDHRAIVLNHQTLLSGPNCGATNPNVPHPTESQVDYILNMKEAQDAYHIVINSAQDEISALHRLDLMQAIGRGIGFTAAHEIAHHFLFSCCTMDADPLNPSVQNPNPEQLDPDARGAFNATGCSGSLDPSPWTGYWPSPKIDLHWERPALDALGQCLSNGWHNYQGSCHN